MNKTPAVTKERLIEEFGTVIGETEQLLKSVATASGEKRDALGAGIDRKLAEATEQLEKIRAESVRQARAAALATHTYVQDNPWRAVGIAAGIAAAAGLVAGLLLSRRPGGP